MHEDVEAKKMTWTGGRRMSGCGHLWLEHDSVKGLCVLEFYGEVLMVGVGSEHGGLWVVFIS